MSRSIDARRIAGMAEPPLSEVSHQGVGAFRLPGPGASREARFRTRKSPDRWLTRDLPADRRSSVSAHKKGAGPKEDARRTGIWDPLPRRDARRELARLPDARQVRPGPPRHSRQPFKEDERQRSKSPSDRAIGADIVLAR